jgi:hypothetical protein
MQKPPPKTCRFPFPEYPGAESQSIELLATCPERHRGIDVSSGTLGSGNKVGKRESENLSGATTGLASGHAHGSGHGCGHGYGHGYGHRHGVSWLDNGGHLPGMNGHGRPTAAVAASAGDNCRRVGSSGAGVHYGQTVRGVGGDAGDITSKGASVGGGVGVSDRTGCGAGGSSKGSRKIKSCSATGKGLGGKAGTTDTGGMNDSTRHKRERGGGRKVDPIIRSIILNPES